MRLLNKHTATLRRRGDGYITVGGDYVNGDSVDTPFRCCVQPKYNKSEYQKVLPEGVHESHAREIYTTTQLLTTSELTQTQADLVEFRGIEYEVFEVAQWDSGTDRLDHYKALVIRRDVLDANR